MKGRKKNEDGTLSLDVDPAAVGVDTESFSCIEENLNHVNSLILEGYAEADENGNITMLEKIAEESDANVVVVDNAVIAVPSGISLRAAGGGVIKIEYYWWGQRLFLSNTVSKNIVLGMNITAVLTGIIPEASITKAVAIVCGITAAVISRFNNGNGVVIDQRNVAGAAVYGAYYIQSQ